MQFESAPLKNSLKAVLAELGLSEMTEIQSRALPALLDGRDLIGQSATGSGKTAAFALPILHALEGKVLQALIICPTRELAAQVARDVRRFGRREPGLHVALLVGGQPGRAQAESLEAGAQIVVGTPGRLLDHLGRGRLNFDGLRTVVLDEADRMLDMGFIDEVVDLIRHTPRSRQTLLFSATYPAEIAKISAEFQRDPVRIKVDAQAPQISHFALAVQRQGEKPRALSQLLDARSTERTLVFCNQKATVNELQAEIAGADLLHGDLEPRDRERVLARFRNGSVRVLIATDVAARGLDIKELDLVVAYDSPHDEATYTHRAGRTARAGAHGLVISIASPAERQRLRSFGIELEMFDKFEAPPTSAKEFVAMRTLRVGGGRKDKLRPGDIVGALTAEPLKLRAEEIGQIEIHDTFTYVGVRAALATRAADALTRGRIKGRRFQTKLI